MNILQITPRLPAPPNDGGAVYIFYTTKYLSLLGQNISLASFISNKHAQDIDELKKYAEVYAVDGKFKPYSFASVLKSTLTRQPVTIQHRMSKDIMEKALDRVGNSPDIILLEGLHTAAFIDSLRSRFKGIPIVLRQSNVEFLLLERNAKSTKNPFLKAFYYDQSRLIKRFELEAMRRVDAVTAITEFDKKTYLHNLPELNCFVSPAGTEIPPSLNIKRKNNKLLAISNWRWKPNIDGLKWFLEEVWPGLIEKNPAIEFDIVGEGLGKRFRKKYSHNKIHYFGFVDDLEPLRQSASIFIAPLFSGSGMKLKIIEGMASGLPIITTKMGAEGIEIENGVHYIKAETNTEFETAISSLLDNPQKRNKLSSEARKKAEEEYGWEKITQELIHFLKTLQ